MRTLPAAGPGARPNRASIVYSNLVRQSFPGLPLVLGGIEASLRRAVHYDFWSDKLRRSILLDAKADLIVYGNGGTGPARSGPASGSRCKRRSPGNPGNGLYRGSGRFTLRGENGGLAESGRDPGRTFQTDGSLPGHGTTGPSGRSLGPCRNREGGRSFWPRRPSHCPAGNWIGCSPWGTPDGHIRSMNNPSPP